MKLRIKTKYSSHPVSGSGSGRIIAKVHGPYLVQKQLTLPYLHEFSIGLNHETAAVMLARINGDTSGETGAISGIGNVRTFQITVTERDEP